jgi:biotin carboxyl carrier protein
LLAEEGARLEKGRAILTLEVMKMEQTLRAPLRAMLKKIKVQGRRYRRRGRRNSPKSTGVCQT